MEVRIQEIIMRKRLVFTCSEKVATYSRISSRGILQWLFYMAAIVQILSTNGRGGYHQEGQGCGGEHDVFGLEEAPMR